MCVRVYDHKQLTDSSSTFPEKNPQPVLCSPRCLVRSSPDYVSARLQSNKRPGVQRKCLRVGAIADVPVAIEASWSRSRLYSASGSVWRSGGWTTVRRPPNRCDRCARNWWDYQSSSDRCAAAAVCAGAAAAAAGAGESDSAAGGSSTRTTAATGHRCWPSRRWMATDPLSWTWTSAWRRALRMRAIEDI